MKYIYLLLVIFALATCGSSPVQSTEQSTGQKTEQEESIANTHVVHQGQGMVIVATVYTIPLGLSQQVQTIVCHTAKTSELGQPSAISTQCIKL